MRMITKRPWRLLHMNSKLEMQLEPGEYHVERRTVPVGDQNVTWLCLVGQPWGASVGSWLQWAPGMIRTKDCQRGLKGGTINWDEFEVRVYDDNGNLLDEYGQPQAEPTT